MKTTSVADALGFLEQALANPLVADEIRTITVPASGDPQTVLGTADPGAYWADPDGTVLAGAGSACTIRAGGDHRFRELRDQLDGLWARIRTVAPEGTQPLVRVLGGVSFLPGAQRGSWQPFGDATFFLPRVLLARTPMGTFLTLAVGDGPGPADPATLLEQARGILDGRPGAVMGFGGDVPGTMGADHEAPTAGAGPATVEGPGDAASWVAAVESIQNWIREGRVEKIVAARHEAVPLAGTGPVGGSSPGETDLETLLTRLDREPSTFRFAFRLGGATFLGATPERLVQRRGPRVRTEALAGTVAAGEEARVAPLLESLKEGAEHAFVVRAIAGALEPVCATLDFPPEPTVQRLRHVHHLRTPFEGELESPVHILELVERLHPTPAVGGWPTDVALAWIRHHEPGDRGWYAAPIGWLDPAGDGEFAVALRSGLLHHGTAYLFAGAGIVADSDARAELRETEVKLRTMKEALGLT